jgi:hypothetical protein
LLIAATNKTPCSASYLPELLNDPGPFRAFVVDYCERLEKLSLPPEMSWSRPAIRQTVELFQRAVRWV